MNDVDDGRTGTAQHNGQWPAKVLINILCPVPTHIQAHTHTSRHPQSDSHIPGQAVALLMFYESRFVCKFVGPQTPKNCNNIWQMFRYCYSSPPLTPLLPALPFQIVRILQTVGSFAHFFAIIMRCCLVPSRIRIRNGENFLYLIWPTLDACLTQMESQQRIQNTASKFHTPGYSLPMPLSLPSFHLYSFPVCWPFFPLQTNFAYIFPFSDKEQQ